MTETHACHAIAAQIRPLMNGYFPRTAIILGSGLGALADLITDTVTIKYADISGFPQSSVAGHKGCLLIGRLAGKDVICLQGRFHLYEGHQPQIISTVIKSLRLLGIENLIVTNAAGSLKDDMPPGSLMLINDHINFSGQNPLCGPNDETLGPRFPAMHEAYDASFRRQIHTLAKAENIPLYDGTYLMVLGPNFETAAEIRAFQILGADAVGMSTVPEVIAAVHCSIKVLGISVITNFGTGMTAEANNHQETLQQASAAAEKLCHLITCFIKEI